MSGCHEPTKSTKDLMIEYIDNSEKSFKTLETLIKANEEGLNKCFEWIENIEKCRVDDVPVTFSLLVKRIEEFENELTTKKYMEQNLREACARIEKLEDNYDSKRDTRKDLNDSLSAIQNDYKNKIELLETHISTVHDLVNMEDRITACDVLNRLTLLENHKNYQIDENRKVSRKFDEIESQLKRLEGFIHPDLILWARVDVTGRLEILEKLSKRFEDDIHDLQVFKSAKVKLPHKCPVCNGSGEWELQSIDETIRNDNKRFKTCHSCEGKGVLWG